MKTIQLKTQTVKTLIIVLATIIGQQIHAADYQTYYLDNLNFRDTIIYCSGNDSLELIKPSVVGDRYFWTTSDQSDSSFVDNLILPNDFEGLIIFEGSPKPYVLLIAPIKVETVGDKTIKCGRTAKLNATTNYMGTGTLTYAWTPTTGLDNSTIPAPTTSVTENTKYTVTLSADGCQAKDSIIINVTPLSTYTNEDQTIVCGGTAQLNVTLNGYEQTTHYFEWTPTTGLDNSTISNPTATVTKNTKYTVTVSADGCQTKDSINVVVEPFSTNIEGDHTIVCGGTTQLDVTTNYTGSGTLTYAWTPTTGLDNSTVSNPASSVTDNTAYTVTVLTPNGCQSEDVVNVNVNPFIANAGEDKTIICGGTAEFDAVTSNYTGSGTLTYAWTPTAGLDNSTISNPMATVTDNTAYTVTALTPNGCQSEDDLMVSMHSMNNPNICMVGVDNTNKNIIVWGKPPSTSIDSFYIFRETNVTNEYQKIGSVAYNDFSVYIDHSSNPNIQSNKYKISSQDACGFESDKSPFHKTMHLSINQGQNNVWNLIWESYEGFTVSTYNIYRGTNPNNLLLIGTSSASNTQYSDFSAPAGDVYYQIEILGPNNCNPEKSSSSILKSTSYNASRSNVATNNPTGLNENLIDSKLVAIYPNPSNNEINIEFQQNSITNRIVEIFAMNGQIVKRVIMNSNKTTINIDTLNSGIYIVHVKTDKGVVMQKLIKQ